MTLKYSATRAIEIVHVLTEVIFISELFTSGEKIDYSHPNGVIQGSLEHAIFLTLTLSIDNGSNSQILWNSARKAYEAENTRYLFSPIFLYEKEADQILYDMKKSGLCGNKNKNAEIWKNAGKFLIQKWGGDPRNFLSSCEWDGQKILNQIIPARYHEMHDFYHFIGERKGQLWLSLLNRDTGIHQIINLNKIPLITDIHIIRTSIALGLIYGSYSGQISFISQKIRELWENALHETNERGRGMTAMELTESLRNLSKNGCSKRDGKRSSCPQFDSCPFNMFCVTGIFSLENKGAFIDTTKEKPGVSEK